MPSSDRDTATEDLASVRVVADFQNDAPTRTEHRGLSPVVAGAGVVLLTGLMLIVASATRPSIEEATPPLPTLESEIARAIVEPPPPTATYVEPDREIEVLVTERDTLIRQEPWTGRVIWESRPLTEPKIVSVDPNTVTVDSRGNRLVVSLTDGTLLPP